MDKLVFSRDQDALRSEPWVNCGVVNDRMADRVVLASKIGTEVLKLLDADMKHGGYNVVVGFVVLTEDEARAGGDI